MNEIDRQEIRRGEGQSSIRCRLIEYAGEWRVDLRLHNQDLPTASGFGLAPAKLPALIAALQHTERTARENGLLTEPVR